MDNQEFVQLQKVLYTSLMDSRSTTRPSNNSFARRRAYRPPVNYRSNVPRRMASTVHRYQNSPYSSPGGGSRRRNNLAREGIFPSQLRSSSTTPQKGSNSKKKRGGSKKMKKQGALGKDVQWELRLSEARKKKPRLTSSNSSPELTGKRRVLVKKKKRNGPSLSTEEEEEERPKNEVSNIEVKWWMNWDEIRGRGRRTVMKMEHEKKPVLVLEAISSSEPFQMLAGGEEFLDSVRNGFFEINLEVMNVKNDGQHFGILLNHHIRDSGGKVRFTSLVMNTFRKEWKIEETKGDKRKLLAKAEDSLLSIGKYCRIKLKVGGNKISLSRGKGKKSKTIFSNFQVKEEGILNPEGFGFSLFQTKSMVRNFQVTGTNNGKKKEEEEDSTSVVIQPDPSTISIQSLPHHIDPKFAEDISRDIIVRDLNVPWDSIGGLDNAKRILKEAIVLPLLLPEMFTGLRAPWSGVLLFGPPGTGKTMLAKAVSTEAKTTFFCASASTVISKWHGESEKLVKTLFQLARFYAPSTIFFDELDSVMMSRGKRTEHEASRRFKSELLSQIDGIHSDTHGLKTDDDSNSNKSNHVMLLATTNRPWDLDDAVRRRLEKRIYVPLPDTPTREKLLRLFLGGIQVDGDVDLKEISERTDGYSGADLKLLCRDASMMPLRKAVMDKSAEEIIEMKKEGFKLTVRREHFIEALKRMKPSVDQDSVKKYKKWFEDFGSS